MNRTVGPSMVVPPRCSSSSRPSGCPARRRVHDEWGAIIGMAPRMAPFIRPRTVAARGRLDAVGDGAPKAPDRVGNRSECLVRPSRGGAFDPAGYAALTRPTS